MRLYKLIWNLEKAIEACKTWQEREIAHDLPWENLKLISNVTLPSWTATFV
jgi:hypothetical protein